MDIPIIGTTVPVVLLLGALIIIITVRIHIAYRHRNKKGIYTGRLQRKCCNLLQVVPEVSQAASVMNLHELHEHS